MKNFGFTLAGATHVTMLPTVARFGFTLAEVLITLGIIGVVAAMTIPNLITNYKQKVYITDWRKTYSEIAQSLRLMQENDEALFVNNDTEYDLMVKVANHIKHSHVCHSNMAVEEGCFAQRYKIFSLQGNSISSKGLDALFGGASCMLMLNGTTVCMDGVIIYVDVNGSNKPNTVGRDIFAAALDRDNYSIRPVIGHRSSYGAADGVIIKNTSGDGTCKKTNNDYGWGCSYWYMHHWK